MHIAKQLHDGSLRRVAQAFIQDFKDINLTEVYSLSGVYNLSLLLSRPPI